MEGSTAPTPTSTPPEPPEKPGEGAPETPPEGSQSGDAVTMTKAEAEALQRQAREGREATKRAEKERKEAEERQAKEQGRWEELAKQREQERDAALARADRVQREATVTRLASGKFHDPADVLHRLREEELADETTIRAGLDRVAKEAPHLAKPAEPAGQPEIGQVKPPAGVTPAEGPTPPGQELTWEQVNAMSAQELAALDEKGWEQVNKVLAAGPPS